MAFENFSWHDLKTHIFIFEFSFLLGSTSTQTNLGSCRSLRSDLDQQPPGSWATARRVTGWATQTHSGDSSRTATSSATSVLCTAWCRRILIVSWSDTWWWRRRRSARMVLQFVARCRSAAASRFPSDSSAACPSTAIDSVTSATCSATSQSTWPTQRFCKRRGQSCWGCISVGHSNQTTSRSRCLVCSCKLRWNKIHGLLCSRPDMMQDMWPLNCEAENYFKTITKSQTLDRFVLYL